MDDYLRGSDRGFAPAVDVEGPDARRLVAESIMSGLRLREGVEVGRFAEGLGDGDWLGRMGAVVAQQVESGLAVERDGRVVLTDQGFLFADGVARAMMAALG